VYSKTGPEGLLFTVFEGAGHVSIPPFLPLAGDVSGLLGLEGLIGNRRDFPPIRF